MPNELKDQLTLTRDQAVLLNRENAALDLRVSWLILMLPSTFSNSVIKLKKKLVYVISFAKTIYDYRKCIGFYKYYIKTRPNHNAKIIAFK